MTMIYGNYRRCRKMCRRDSVSIALISCRGGPRYMIYLPPFSDKSKASDGFFERCKFRMKDDPATGTFISLFSIP
ncbi:hypothetical protein CEXT_637931 [Caerostris extrusa]|uniref:Uncharacterized protein n=1 Tax=Caerostris extrusa TaxID=172846 RepID=A0AAV4TM95_CAEEX|nr:hypothetical protein CEXT_637931 [Caerostris extrusa]